MKGIVLCLVSVVLFLAVEGCHQNTDHKQKLRVLYVGTDPGRELPPRNFAHGAGIAECRYEEDMRGRMPSFEKLLKSYFTEVGTVDARDYREEMTTDYDVVIFDAVPEPIVPGEKSGGKRSANVVDTKELFSARYFSDSYSKPTLFVGDKAGILGAAIGLKLNWFCRCLDAHAYDLDTTHPIFHEPVAVDLQYERRLTTSSAMSGVEGVTTPGVMDTWRVQIEGYREGERKRYRQGLVAHGDGFEDTPDAERITGGVSDKARDAVAIGRHGNFFMWGFAADPDYMTEAAKKVFVNAVCYIQRFGGQVPVARKYMNGWVTREKMRKQLDLYDEKTYDAYLRNSKEYNEKLMALKREVDELNAARKDVPGDLIAQAWPQSRVLMEREAFEEKYMRREANKFGIKDLKDYRYFLEENMDYFYGGKGDFSFSVDTDLKELGIPVGDVRVLDKGVELLKGNAREREMGERLLRRYTLKEFATVAEWTEWLNRVRGQLQFTESCWYKFLECGVAAGFAMPLLSSVGGVCQENPVAVALAGTNDTLMLTFKMEPGFHIYSVSGEAGAYVLTKVEFRYPEGVRARGGLIAPEGKVYEADEKVRIYEGTVVFKQPIVVEGQGGRITCTTTYQACNNSICLPPVTEELLMDIKNK